MKYIKGINGLRALAVLLVIISHWFPKTFFLNKLPLGTIGVDIFFVISGFLITSILLRNNEEIKAQNDSFFNKLKAFFLKRTIRIFPIYYVLLFFLYFTNGDEFRDYFVYYLTYTSNYLFYNTQSWHGFTAHFWSLAVEEQFYLFWPILIFLIPKKNTFFLILSLIFSGIVYSAFFNGNMSRILTISCLPTLGFGALLAYLEYYKIKWRIKFYSIVKFLFYPLMFLTILNYIFIESFVYPISLVVSLITFRILLLCIDEKSNSLLFKFLNLNFTNYLGVISYGIYLYHNIIPSYWRRLIRKYNIEFFYNDLQINFLEMTFKFLILLIVSSLSWYLFEKPLLKLKKYI